MERSTDIEKNTMRKSESHGLSVENESLLVFGEGHLALGATAGLSSSQTPWGTLRHSYGSVSVITLY